VSVKVTVGQQTFIKKIVLGTPVTTARETLSIDEFTDFNVATKSDAQILVFDSAEGVFKNYTFNVGQGLAREYSPGDDKLIIAIDSDKTPVVTGILSKGNLTPTLDSTFDLGDSNRKWKDLHLSGSTIHLGGIKLKDSGGDFSVKDSAGTPVNIDLTGSTQQIRGFFSSGGDLSYDSTTGRFEFDVEQVYTKANFDSDLGDALDGGVGIAYDSASDTIRIDSAELEANFKQDIRGYFTADKGLVYSPTTGNFDVDSANLKTIISANDAGGDGSFSYNNSTGVFTYTGPSPSQVRSHFSAQGDLSYDSTTGVFQFDVEEVYTRANFESDLGEALAGGTGITYDSSSDTINITNTGVSAGSYGSATQVPVLNINAQGQVTSASTAAVAGIDSIGFDSVSGIFTINTADGQVFNSKIADSSFTASRARDVLRAIDDGGDGSFAYDSPSGTFTYIGPSATEVRAHFTGGTGISITSGDIKLDSSELTNLYRQTIRGYINATDAGGDGSFTYDGSTGTLTYTGPSVDSVRSHFTGGDGIGLSSGVIRIDSAELTNLYRQTIRGYLSVIDAGGDGSFAYDSSTGQITYTGPSVDSVRSHFTGGSGIAINSGDIKIDSAELTSLFRQQIRGFINVHDAGGDGTFEYDSATGKLTYTGPSASDVRAHFSASNSLSYDSSTGDFRLPQPLDSAANPTFNQLRGPASFVIDPATIGDNTGTVRILGNLQVEGTQTIINSTTVSLNDKNIVIADSAADSSALDGGGITWGGSSIVDTPTFNYSHANERLVSNREINAPLFSGSGASLTNLPAASLTGTIDSARIPTLLIADIGNINSIDHDALTNFVANEHIDHSGVSIDAGFGLKGGGSIVLSRDLAIDSSELTSYYRPLIRSYFTANKGLSVTLGEFNIDSANVRGMFSAAGDLSYNSGTGQFSIDVEDVYTKENFDSDYFFAKDSANTAVERNQHDTTTKNFAVTVASKTGDHVYSGGSSNAYYIDGTESPIINLKLGRTYRFNLSSSDMSNHPFRFYYDAARTTIFETGVTSTGTYTEIAITESTPPVLHYQCSSHPLMGHAVQIGTRNFTGFTTTNLTEGTNLYYTDTRFDNRFATKSTSNLSEGSNLYFTNARAQAVSLDSAEAIQLIDSAYVQARQRDSAATQAMIDSNLNNDITFGGDVAFDSAGAIFFDKSDQSLKFGTNRFIKMGESNELTIAYRGGNSIIDETGGGALIVKTNNFKLEKSGTSELMIQAINDGSVSLYYDNVKKFETDSHGIAVTGPNLGSTIGDTVEVADFFVNNGNGSSLRINKIRDANGSSWTTSATRIQQVIDVTEQGYIQFNGADNNYGLELGTTGSEKFFRGIKDGAVELYHDNIKQFETTSTGASIRPDSDDVGLVVGKAHIGHTAHNDWAAFAHFDNRNAGGSYALLQNSAGRTLLNAASGQFIEFRRNNTTIGKFETNGDLTLENGLTVNGDVIFDSSGAIMFDQSDKALEVNSSLYSIDLVDNARIKFGTGSDAYIRHTGSLLQVISDEGGINIKTNANDQDVILQSDDGSGGTVDYLRADGSSGAVKLSHYGSVKFQTTDSGVNVTGNLIADSASIRGGVLEIKNTGVQSEVRLFCEDANQHYVALKAPAHSTFSGNVALTLPSYDGTIISTSNSNAPTTTTNVAHADHILIDDGGTMKKITPTNLGIVTGVTVQDSGSSLSTLATTLNFVGAGVVASGSGSTKTITISGTAGGGGGAVAGGDTQVQFNDGGAFGADAEFTFNKTSNTLTVGGPLIATSKSFDIKHPTKKGQRLRYGSLEGPENGVYVRGRANSTKINLPDYWTGLVDEETITVNLTPIGKHQKLYVEDISNNTVTIGNDNLIKKEINCFYTIYAERKDINKITVEYKR